MTTAGPEEEPLAEARAVEAAAARPAAEPVVALQVAVAVASQAAVVVASQAAVVVRAAWEVQAASAAGRPT